MTAHPLLSVDGLRVGFGKHGQVLSALPDVSFKLDPGKTLALVGESGSGKSVSSLAIMGLLPRKGHVTAGAVTYRRADGTEVNLADSDEPMSLPPRPANMRVWWR